MLTVAVAEENENPLPPEPSLGAGLRQGGAGSMDQTCFSPGARKRSHEAIMHGDMHRQGSKTESIAPPSQREASRGGNKVSWKESPLCILFSEILHL